MQVACVVFGEGLAYVLPPSPASCLLQTHMKAGGLQLLLPKADSIARPRAVRSMLGCLRAAEGDKAAEGEKTMDGGEDQALLKIRIVGAIVERQGKYLMVERLKRYTAR